MKNQSSNKGNNIKKNRKDQQLDQFKVNNEGTKFTTNQGVKVSNDEESLKAGVRGPTLMEGIHFKEKLSHFDRERIPERVVHARGYAAHGEFECYESMKEYTTASFLQEAGQKTPVFTRFSNVAGSSGSADTARDVRGFAVKFYTEEGNYDLVGNNLPVFFIQDSIKFPDLIHAVKPEPNTEMPQAASAHDTFWDFVANNQESAHMVMWQMSDRTIPRSWRMMEGFGIHTFRFVNSEGKASFVKFHWKPILGVHSLVWDEAQKIAGKDADFQRRDLWENIENGYFAEYEFGVQMIAEEDEFMFDFDILDPTKLWPEEIVPVKIIGKMTLNQNVTNVFAETEQAAFHPGNVVPGIDFSNDPLLQGRLLSYLDTQLYRLGGPNFTEIPINRSICPFHNNQRNGFNRQRIDVGPVSYHKNSLANNTPSTSTAEEGGFVHYAQKVEGRVIQARSKSFDDFFSQARLFWNSMSPPEKQHIINAFSFELGKVNSVHVRQQVVDMFCNVDKEMATTIAMNIGVNKPTGEQVNVSASSPALSQEHTNHFAYSLKVGIIIGNEFTDQEVKSTIENLSKYGVWVYTIGEKIGTVKGKNGLAINISDTFLTTAPVLFDSLYVVGGSAENQAKFNSESVYFINEAFKHYKPIGIASTGNSLFKASDTKKGAGIIQAENTSEFSDDFIRAISQQRFWERQIY
ncbi:catalase [Sporosarcina sp. GW1-11]|uniref:catalase n=1 Tax=Sporosarcina sp. GW1-11 TaxID=2899126 RepID=UPI00294CDA9B|nr:catalase [Sporosarcina sp. GW1-11]MDV6377885.1 catalase [Sporosarcina sp. GW1-11]